MSASQGHVFQFGDWRLDPVERLLQRNGVSVPLTPKVFETLLVLVENAGKLVTKDEFMKRVWPDTFVEDLALVQNISQIRKVINGHGPVIETVSKRGYRLIVPVKTGPATSTREEDAPITPRDAAKIPETRDLVSGTNSRRRESLWFVSAAGVLLVLATLVLSRNGVLHKISGRNTTDAPQPVILPIISLPGEERMPALSPEGDRVAFVWEAPEPSQWGIYVAVVGSQSMIRLTNSAGDVWPAWSRDGRYVAFERYDGRKESIFLVPALGGPERLLFSGEHAPWTGPEGVSLSPDGKWLAFGEWSPDTQQSSIKLLALDGSASRTLTSPPQGFRDAGPSFSPDGTRIAFARSTGPIFVDDIFVVPVNGGQPTQITSDRRRIWSPPAWTQDGQELLFASNRAGLRSLWRVSANGGEPAPVPGTGPGADRPTVSLSTGEIAFEYALQNENIWRMELRKNVSSGEPRALFAQRTPNLMPQVSPDGTKIAFESGRSGYDEIWISDADGGNATQVTHLERYAGSPRWSPDGRFLAFDFRSAEHTEIDVIELAKGTPRPLVTSPDADNVVPSWSRDGRWIYFGSNRGNKTFQIWKIPAQGGAPVQVTRNGGFMALESLDGRSVFYSKLAKAGIWQVPVEGGPEKLAYDGFKGENWAEWTVGEDGLYFVDWPKTPPDINFIDFKSGKTSLVGKMQGPAFVGITLSPDRKYLVYSQRSRDEHQILMTKLVH